MSEHSGFSRRTVLMGAAAAPLAACAPPGPAEKPPAPDPGDQLLWELLAACPAARLLTRDRLLLRKGRLRRRVLLPEAFDLASARVA